MNEVRLKKLIPFITIEWAKYFIEKDEVTFNEFRVKAAVPNMDIMGKKFLMHNHSNKWRLEEENDEVTQYRFSYNIRKDQDESESVSDSFMQIKSCYPSFMHEYIDFKEISSEDFFKKYQTR